MAFLTDEKLVIVGAGGMIGSNMVQSVLMLGLTPAHSLAQTSLTLLIPRRLSQVLSTSSLQVVLPVRRV